MKDTRYYDQESLRYSKKRYPESATTYTQFLFKERLAHLLRLLQESFANRRDLELLEIGCADGYVLSKVQALPIHTQRLIGVDISPGMIEAAKLGATEKTGFHLRGTYDFGQESFDGIIEVGVLNLTDLGPDLLFAKNHLREDGYYFCSIAASTSLTVKLKPDNENDYRHFLTYPEYEAEIRKEFHILRSIPYGLFIPYLWRFPSIARVVQPAIERLFRSVAPNVFHEKLFLLKKR